MRTHIGSRVAVIVGVGALLLGGGTYVTVALAGDVSAPPSQAGVARVSSPDIQQQAQSLTGMRLAAPQYPHTVPVQAFSDGCDRGYGTTQQCVPLRAAGNLPITCTYLRQAGWLATPLQVNDDHLHLMAHGRVCG